MAQLDPSIILGVKPIDVPDQTGMLLKALQAQQLMGQSSLQGLQIQQGQRQADEQGRLTQVLSDPANQGLDRATLAQKIITAAPISGQAVVKGMLDTQKTQGEIAKTAEDTEHAQIGRTASMVGAAASQGPSAISDAIDASPAPAATKARLKAQLAADPSGGANFAKQFVASALTADQQLEQTKKTFLPTEQGIAALDPYTGTGSMVSGASGPASYTNGAPGVGPGVPAGQGTAPAASPTPTVPSGQPSPNGFPRVTPAVQMQRDSDRLRILNQELASSTNPSDRAAIQSEIARTTATQAAGTPFASQGASLGQPAVPSAPVTAPALGARREEIVYHTDPLTGQTMALPKYAAPGAVPGGTVGAPQGGPLSAADQAIVDLIGTNRQAAPTGNASRNPRMVNIMAAVSDQYPNFDATEFPARQKALRDFSTGVQGNALRSVAVASDHLDQLAQAGAALQNGNYQLVNKVANVFDTQTGGTAQGSFNAIKQIVGDEVLKAVIGGGAGGVSDRAELAAQLKDASTPDQLNAVIGQYRKLMGAQKDALVSQYENTTGRTDAATRFNFGKKGGAPQPVPQNQVDALLSKYGN